MAAAERYALRNGPAEFLENVFERILRIQHVLGPKLIIMTMEIENTSTTDERRY
jgi:hypothetical protein